MIVDARCREGSESGVWWARRVVGCVMATAMVHKCSDANESRYGCSFFHRKNRVPQGFIRSWYHCCTPPELCYARAGQFMHAVLSRTWQMYHPERSISVQVRSETQAGIRSMHMQVDVYTATLPIGNPLTTRYTHGRTFPGFIIPLGSSRFFIPRINASSSGVREKCIACRFSSPMPCSALTLPPTLFTHSYTNGSNAS